MNLHRVKWGCRGALAVGVAVSIAGNVLHADDNWTSRIQSGWPPVALLITIELIAKVPVNTWWLAVGRIVTCAAVGGFAAWVSYTHMTAVALRYGEEPVSAHLYPLITDGLVVVAWICLAELSKHDRPAVNPVPPADEPDGEPPADPWPFAEPPAEPDSEPEGSASLAARIVAAHHLEPNATHKRIAALAGASVPSVKRHRPKRDELNGHAPDFEGVSR